MTHTQRPKHTAEPWKLVSTPHGTSIVGAAEKDPNKEVYIATVESSQAHARHAYEAPGPDAIGNAALLASAASMFRVLKAIRTKGYGAKHEQAPAAILEILRMVEAELGGQREA